MIARIPFQQLRRVVLMTLGAFLLPSLAMAQEPPPPQTEQAATRIEVDETSHVIRFIVNGQPVAMIDSEGLHVVQDIEYGGTISDVDGENVRRRIEEIAPPTRGKFDESP